MLIREPVELFTKTPVFLSFRRVKRSSSRSYRIRKERAKRKTLLALWVVMCKEHPEAPVCTRITGLVAEAVVEVSAAAEAEATEPEAVDAGASRNFLA
jgi:hypothetical protein